MNDWAGSPVVWVGVFTALSVAVGIIFAAGQWKGRVDSDRDIFRATLKEIRDDIKRIFERLPPATVATGSPIALTELGQSVSQTLGGSAWAENHATILAGRAAGAPAYDIEELAFNYVANEFTPDDAMETKIKQCAYENGLKRKQVLKP